MEKLYNVSLEYILKSVGVLLEKEDILYICDDRDTIVEYKEVFNNTESKTRVREIVDVLIKHEDKIDKDFLVMISLYNCKKRVEELTEKLNNVPELGQDAMLNNKIKRMKAELKEQKATEIEKREILKELGKDIKRCIVSYNYGDRGYYVKVMDPKEIVRGKSISEEEKIKRLKRIDRGIVYKEGKKEENVGLELIVGGISLTDYTEIFDKRVGDIVTKCRGALIDNKILKNNNLTYIDIERMKQEDEQKYDELVRKVEGDNEAIIIGEVEMLYNYAKYIDIDKLLLIASYRLQKRLENGNFKEKEDYSIAKKVLVLAIDNLMDTKKEYNFQLQVDNNGKKQNIKFSGEDIRTAIQRFSMDSYLSKSYIEDIRKKVQDETILLSDVKEDEREICFSKEERENILLQSDANFKDVVEKQSWDKEKILKALNRKGNCSEELLRYLIGEIEVGFDAEDIFNLYMDNIIGISQMRIAGFLYDFSKVLDTRKIIKLYCEKEKDEEALRKYEKYIDLYRMISTKDKTIDTEESSSNLMEDVIEKYDYSNDQWLIQATKELYKKEMIHLNDIFEWWSDDGMMQKVLLETHNEHSIKFEETKQALENEKKKINEKVKKEKNKEQLEKKECEKFEEKVTFLYLNGIINLNELKLLVAKKIAPFEIFAKVAQDTKISYEKRKEIIFQGLVEEEDIIILYLENLIKKEDLEELANKSIISKRNAKKAIQDAYILTLDVEQSLQLDFSGMKKIERNESIYTPDDGYPVPSETKGEIIDPNEREKLFDLLHAGVVPREGVEINEDSPFYNYKFYGIPDESGNITKDSIIIAERIYKDIETETKFALENATYIFKYGDIDILNGYMKKDDVMKNIKGRIYRVNHFLSTDSRRGAWGRGVMESVAKIMGNIDCSDKTESERKDEILRTLLDNYTRKEVNEILDKALEIDYGYHTYDVIGPRLNKGKERTVTRNNSTGQSSQYGQSNNGDIVGENR